MANGRLTGKVAVVTGGASGIGLATVRRFVADGAQVMIGDIAGDRAAEVATELGQAVASRRCDVSAESDVEELFEDTQDRFGAVHIAFANAGIGSFAPVIDAEVPDWMRVLEVNLVGPLLTIKHAARRMAEGGSIVHTAVPRPGWPCWRKWRRSNWVRKVYASMPSDQGSSAPA
jgi:NAD(P)-dependent dehydrogenase (short-subunit alcohol dehydrogenase family)